MSSWFNARRLAAPSTPYNGRARRSTLRFVFHRPSGSVTRCQAPVHLVRAHVVLNTQKDQSAEPMDRTTRVASSEASYDAGVSGTCQSPPPVETVRFKSCRGSTIVKCIGVPTYLLGNVNQYA